jgi:hypothetical protein
MRYHDAPLFEFIAVLSALVIGGMCSSSGHQCDVSRGRLSIGNVVEHQFPVRADRSLAPVASGAVVA